VGTAIDLVRWDSKCLVSKLSCDLPTTPTISATGNAMPHTLRCDGMGATIGEPTAIVPLGVLRARDRCARAHKRLRRHQIS